MPKARTHVSLDELLELRHQAHKLMLLQRSLPLHSRIGKHRARLRGRGMEFDQVRVYQQGDDVRSIDWRVTARTGEPYTKIYQEERERPVFILVEQSNALFYGSSMQFKSVVAAEAAALCAWSVALQKDHVGGFIFSAEHSLPIKPKRGQNHALHFLAQLASANQQLSLSESAAKANLEEILRQLLYSTHARGIAIIICDLKQLTAAAVSLLTALSQHLELILMPISDPLDWIIPSGEDLYFGQNSTLVRVSSFSQNVRQQWLKIAQGYHDQWQSLAETLNCALIPLSTSKAVNDQLEAVLCQN